MPVKYKSILKIIFGIYTRFNTLLALELHFSKLST